MRRRIHAAAATAASPHGLQPDYRPGQLKSRLYCSAGLQRLLRYWLILLKGMLPRCLGRALSGLREREILIVLVLTLRI